MKYLSAFIMKAAFTSISSMARPKDSKARGLNREDAMDRNRWRKQIGMIDDHNECEWVNVSSGTGSPGLSQTKSTEP